jgi:hypothetical protein
MCKTTIYIQKKNFNHEFHVLTNCTNFSCSYSCNSLICVIRDYSFDFFVFLVTFVSLCLITEKVVLLSCIVRHFKISVGRIEAMKSDYINIKELDFKIVGDGIWVKSKKITR